MNDARPRLSTTLVAAVAFATLGLIEAAQVYLGLSVLGNPMPWSWAVRSTLPSWLVLFGLVVPLLSWLDQSLAPNGRRHYFVVHGFAALVFVSLHLAGSALLGEVMSPDKVGVMNRLLTLGSFYFVIDLFTYVAVVGAHYSIRRSQADARRDLESARMLADLSQARLLVLEGRLRPDFFFNALNAIVGLMERGDSEKGADALSSLGSLVRTSLAKPSRSTPVSNEVDVVANYLSIQELRFPNRLRTRVRVTDDARDLPFPPLVLLQLVESVVDHSLSSGEPLTLDISASRSNDALNVSIIQSVPFSERNEVVLAAGKRLAAFEPKGDVVLGEHGGIVLQFRAFGGQIRRSGVMT